MTGPEPGSIRSTLKMRWPSLLVGIALVAAVAAAALGRSEEREIWDLARRAEPAWLLAALLAQAATYVAQAQIWRRVAGAAGVPVPLGLASKLSLAKLFVDQAVPTSGVSGTLLFANALERRGVARHVLTAAVSVNLVSYFAAYIMCMLAALAAARLEGHAGFPVLAAAAVFIAASSAFAAALWALSGPEGGTLVRRVRRVPLLAGAARHLAGADRGLAHDPRILRDAVLLQAAIVVLDAATVWTLLAALGSHAPAGGVFASFVLSSMLRSISFVPGGLGVFEAASVVTLKLAGVPLPAALSATLLFRALSFWLPMIPGLVFSRRASATVAAAPAPSVRFAYWSREAADVAAALESSVAGLSRAEAARRLALSGPNALRGDRAGARGWLLLKQVRNPLLLLLAFAAALSAATGSWLEAAIVLAILVASVAVGYSRERRAERSLAELRSRIEARALVLRDGQEARIPAREIVSGDVVVLSAGSVVPADGVLLEAVNLSVNEAVLTGESYPAAKSTGAVAPESAVTGRTNCAFQGTSVRSGTGRLLVVATGESTELGAVAHRLELRPPETEFEHGVRRFGYFLTVVMLAIVLLVFSVNLALDRPVVETLLFSIALAVGLSPELLPAILSINLSRGAREMAHRGVLVRSLNAIENLGSIDILCTDKTGTVTEGVVRLDGAWDADGSASRETARLAAINASLQAGLANPLDEAILRDVAVPPGVRKLGEIPYDFERKRLGVVVEDGGAARLVVKGAFESVLACCSRLPAGEVLDGPARAALQARFEAWGRSGVRALAVAVRDIDVRPSYAPADESGLRFAGFLTFLDRPKAGAREAVESLAALGVSVRLITGDNRLVAAEVAARVGLPAEPVLTGREIGRASDAELEVAFAGVAVFAEVDPGQKERIVRMLRRRGHVVGFMGDGINDAPAMHAADASVSVDTAVDVARDAADFVLLERDLSVVRRGIEEGRRTFANTMKYLLMTMSANLGNMVSMAAASLVLPFLPLLAGQVLLNNFLSDLPAFGLAADRVDPELVARPRRWDLRFIGRFMLRFGLLSSLFDFATFAVLLLAFLADAALFRTAWFVESLLSEVLVALMIRTARPFWQSRPGGLLLYSSIGVAILAIVLPYLPQSGLLGFVPMPAGVLAAVLAITAAYVAVTEAAKRGIDLVPQTRSA